MTEFMPLSIIAAYIAFFGFLNTHQRHSAQFEGASETYLFALNISLLLGLLTGLGLLIYYGFTTAWYWPVILFVIGSVIGGLIFGLLDIVFGTLIMSIVSFVGWPMSAFIMYRIITQL